MKAQFTSNQKSKKNAAGWKLQTLRELKARPTRQDVEEALHQPSPKAEPSVADDVQAADVQEAFRQPHMTRLSTT
eukprot:10502834-Prorocentrum_lima.AAC.1